MYFYTSVLIVMYLLRLWLSGFGGVHPDEAYYWSWAQNLRLGYFDHPPMIAWIIRAGQDILGLVVPKFLQSEFPLFFQQIAFRAAPFFVSSVIAPYLVGLTVQTLQRRSLRTLQSLLLVSAPVFLLGPQVITPDAPFFAAWAFVLYCSARLHVARPEGSLPGDPTPFSWTWSLLAGFGLALCAYSKYAAVLAALLFVISGAGLFNSLVAGTTALALTLPYFAWAVGPAAAQGAGIVFQFNHGIGSPWTSPNFRRLGDLIAAQIFCWGPTTFFGVFTILAARYRRPWSWSLALWALVPLAFFSMTALRQTTEANWPLIGVVGALVLCVREHLNHPARLLWASFVNIFIVSAALLMLLQGPFVAKLIRPMMPGFAAGLERPSRLHEFADWPNFHALAFEATLSDNAPVLVQSYQLLSELLFHDAAAREEERLGTRLKIWDEGSRRSQFHLDPAYSSAGMKGPRWMIVAADQPDPPGCALEQYLYRGLDENRRYRVLKCSGAGA